MVRKEVQAHHPIEESGSFSGRKARARLAPFGQLTTRAQASQGQGRVGAGSDHRCSCGGRWPSRNGQSPIAGYSNLNRRTPMMKKAAAKASRTPHGNNTPENPMPRTITF